MDTAGQPATIRHLGSTYRLQLRPGDLAWAATVLAYLHDIGVETLYLSPIATARPASSHGYDVTDPTAVDPALGGGRAWRRLLHQANSLGMGVLVDIVPNHLAASEHTPGWADVLRHGRRSRWAAVFDIDWSAHHGRVLLPLLGAPFDQLLASGELSVAAAASEGEPAGIVAGEPVVRYGPRRFPLDPRTWTDLASGPDELGSLVAGRRGRPATWGPMRQLLERQHYRLAWWRTAPADIGYRRFFDIDDLVGVRMEDSDAFDRTQGLVLAMGTEPAVAGVRVDHVDGLADPDGYLQHLRRQLGMGTGPRPVVLVEKIVARGEPVPPWPVDGTTGYEFADLAIGLMVDATGAATMAHRHASFVSLARDGRRLAMARLFPGQLGRTVHALAAVVRERPGGHDHTEGDVGWAVTELTAALMVYRTYAASTADQAALAMAVDRALADPGGPPDPSVAPAAAHDPRTVLRCVADTLLLSGIDAADPPTQRQWRAAVTRWQQLASAVAAKGVEDTALYRFAGALVGADVGAEPDEPAVSTEAFHRAMAQRQRRSPCSLNATSTHDSKRSEDVRTRLAALTEHAAAFEGAVARWTRRHAPLRDASGCGPHPIEERQLYQALVGIWPLQALAPTSHSDPRRRDLADRLQQYAVKAAREAKLQTSWTDPDAAHEQALCGFVDDLLTSPTGDRFVGEMDRMVARLGPAAAVDSLSLVALKATAPGVPDIYQGCEQWCFALVDPDNRAPLDLAAARDRWEAARVTPMAALVSRWTDGRVKARVTAELLLLRRERPDLFGQGRYVPVPAEGPRADHVVAFARHHGRRWSLTVVARLVGSLGAAPGSPPRIGAKTDASDRPLTIDVASLDGTALRLPARAPARWRNVLDGATVSTAGHRLPVATVWGTVPVAVLVEA